jgi:peroxiredoxin 5
LLKIHLPGYIKNIDLIHAKGYEVVVCVTVNDAFVTSAWSQKLNAAGKITILADPNAEFTKVFKF